jgi:hypothetical protein
MKKDLIVMRLILVVSIFALAFTSCKKDKEDENPDPDPTSGTVVMKFDHRWGNTFAPFAMNESLTHPATSEIINFQTLNYYISNVKLQREDGSWWIQDESYHLVKVAANATTQEISLSNVPLANYTGIEFTIGVDSTRNVSGAQSGALSTSHGMFWSWNTGYIFIKAEGTSPDSPTGGFSYHIGGFRESNNTNAIRTNALNFGGETLGVTGTNHPKIHLFVNAARFWHGGISLEDIHTVHMPGANAITLADNFKEAFVIDHID